MAGRSVKRDARAAGVIACLTIWAGGVVIAFTGILGLGTGSVIACGICGPALGWVIYLQERDS